MNLREVEGGPSRAGLRQRPSRGAPEADRREHLLAAAARAIVRHGSGVRTRDIAEEAGVSTGVVHYYFGTKSDLLVEALRWATREPVSRLVELRGDGDALTALAALVEVSLPHEGPLCDEYVLWLDFWARVAHDRDLLPVCEELASAYRDQVVALIREGTDAGIYSPRAEPLDVAERIIAMVDGLAFRTVVGYTWLPLDRVRTLLRDFVCEQLGIDPQDLPDLHLESPAALGRALTPMTPIAT